MPGVSGIELHAALQEVRPELLDRLLFCTGEVESAAVVGVRGGHELPRAGEAVRPAHAGDACRTTSPLACAEAAAHRELSRHGPARPQTD